MVLKPQDILVLLKLVALNGQPRSYGQLAQELSMSPSEAHAAVKRTLAARLAVQQEARVTPVIRNLEEFILHGLRYVFIPELGTHTRGIPTGAAAPPLSDIFVSGDDSPWVWPDPDGQVRGVAFQPMYRSVPCAARADDKLYELLALVDAIRGGRARERAMGAKELQKRFDYYGKTARS